MQAKWTIIKLTSEGESLFSFSATLESTRIVEWLSDDTFINNNVIKRVWPASQRDACFWSHIRHITANSDEGPDSWIVVNYSTDHSNCPVSVFAWVIVLCLSLVGDANLDCLRDNAFFQWCRDNDGWEDNVQQEEGKKRLKCLSSLCTEIIMFLLPSDIV